jgi:hypothetical protein
VQPNQDITFFVDRTHQGKRFLALLREANVAIEPHNQHFKKTEDDHIWIPEVTRRGWIIISGDKHIEAGINRVAVIDSAAKVFILSDTNSRPIFWGAAFLAGLRSIIRRVQENNGPFFVDVDRECFSHVSHPRFVAHGGPIYQEPDALSMGLTIETPATIEPVQITDGVAEATELQMEMNYPEN